MEKQKLEELLKKKQEARKEAKAEIKKEEGETPQPQEKIIDSSRWKYLFSIQKSKPKPNIHANGKLKVYDNIKVTDFGDLIEIHTLDYTEIKRVSNYEEVKYTKMDAELMSNPFVENKKVIKKFISQQSLSLSNNKPYIERSITAFLDNIFLDYFNEEKGHIVFIRNSFDSLFYKDEDAENLKRYTYKKIVSEGAYRNLNIKLSFNHESSDYIWSIYEDIISDMKEVKRKINRGNIYFSDYEKETEGLKLKRLLHHLTKIKDKFDLV